MERSTQYTSFGSRKQPANVGSERKKFTENASVALQQPILTHARIKCPPVHTSTASTFQREYCRCFTFKIRNKKFLLKCTNHGGMYDGHQKLA